MAAPGLHRLDGGLHVAVAGDDDDLGVGQFLAGLAEDGQAVQAVHLQIGEDDVGIVLLDHAGAGRAAGGDDALVADAFQALGHDLGMVGFIVDNEQLQAFARVFSGMLARSVHADSHFQIEPDDNGALLFYRSASEK